MTDRPTAAIAPRLAATLYGLDILVEDVEDHPDNQTRFVSVARSGIPAPTGHDRTSIACFQSADHPGSLYAILGPVRRPQHQPRASSSRGPPNRPSGDYCFIIDFEGHVADAVVADCLPDLHAESGRGQVPRLVSGVRPEPVRPSGARPRRHGPRPAPWLDAPAVGGRAPASGPEPSSAAAGDGRRLPWRASGGMAERTNARLLKSREVQASVGSNPTPSACCAYYNVLAFHTLFPMSSRPGRECSYSNPRAISVAQCSIPGGPRRGCLSPSAQIIGCDGFRASRQLGAHVASWSYKSGVMLPVVDHSPSPNLFSESPNW